MSRSYASSVTLLARLRSPPCAYRSAADTRQRRRLLRGLRDREPDRGPDAQRPARRRTATFAWPPTARWRRKGRSGTRPVGVFLDTPAGSLTYDLGERPSGVGVPAAGRRQRHLQDLRRRRRQPVRLQAARRDRERRQRRPRPAHAPRDHRADGGPLPPDRRAAGRQRVLDLRVPGLLPGARTRSRPSCRSSTRRRRRSSRRPGRSSTGSRTTRARASRWALAISAPRCSSGGSGWTSRARRDAHREAARSAADRPRRRLVRSATSTSACGTSGTTSTSGTRSTTTSGRSTSKSCPTTGSTSASRSPTPRSRGCAAASSCAR